jgi:hypothetical protein
MPQIPAGDGHVFAPTDFETQTLHDGLDASGFDFLSPADAEELVGRCGLEVVDHPDRAVLHERYFAGREDELTPYTAERIMTAAVRG